jgi:hypothetical protein
MAVPTPTFLALWRKEAVAPNMPRWCTTLTMAVYTDRGGDHLHAAALDRGQVGTALGVAVPLDKQWRCQPNSSFLGEASWSPP